MPNANRPVVSDSDRLHLRRLCEEEERAPRCSHGYSSTCCDLCEAPPVQSPEEFAKSLAAARRVLGVLS